MGLGGLYCPLKTQFWQVFVWSRGVWAQVWHSQVVCSTALSLSDCKNVSWYPVSNLDLVWANFYWCPLVLVYAAFWNIESGFKLSIWFMMWYVWMRSPSVFFFYIVTSISLSWSVQIGTNDYQGSTQYEYHQSGPLTRSMEHTYKYATSSVVPAGFLTGWWFTGMLQGLRVVFRHYYINGWVSV